MKCIIFIQTLIAGLTSAALLDSHVMHEKRDFSSSEFVKRHRVSSDALLPVRIGLTQSNLDGIHDYLIEISDPNSKKYGQVWTSTEVIEAFKPTEQTVNAVTEWLSTEGIENFTHSDNKGWFAFNAPASLVEKLLHAEYYEHEHLESGSIVLACESYYLPKHVQQHVDFVTPGVNLMGKAHVQMSGNHLKKRSRRQALMRKQSNYPDRLHSNLTADLSTCDEVVTPACIAALYQIPPGSSAHPNNSMGIYESDVEMWSQTHLDQFFDTFYPQIPNGTHPIGNDIDGGIDVTSNPLYDGGEVMLDLDLSYPIVYPQTITVWNVDDINYQEEVNATYTGGFNTFLDALDGSYCTYSAYGETGDDTIDGLDPSYPDPLPGGYTGELQCGVFEPTTVISISYGGAEANVPVAYQKRQCNEFAKLGLQGVSFLLASGDAGVGQDPAPYGPGCLGSQGNIFSPLWPASCPYVTAVGGTKVYPGYTVFDPESAVFDPAGDYYAANYSSGGGFSNIYGAPSYQETALNTYFAAHDPDHPFYSALAPDAPNPTLLNITALAGNTGGIYNRIGRGLPDVSANGDNIPLFSQGGYYLSGGTSASTPIFASVINRINNERMNTGKSPLGFLNPALYANPQILNDIVNGTNVGCGVNGFPAVEGWDPVTGLGTPNYPKMLDFFLGLP